MLRSTTIRILHAYLSIAFFKGRTECQFIFLYLGKKTTAWDSRSLSSGPTSICYVNSSKSLQFSWTVSHLWKGKLPILRSDRSKIISPPRSWHIMKAETQKQEQHKSRNSSSIWQLRADSSDTVTHRPPFLQGTSHSHFTHLAGRGRGKGN